jgi:L-asparaginase
LGLISPRKIKMSRLLVITTGGTIAQEHDELGTGVSTQEGEMEKSKKFAELLSRLVEKEGFGIEVASIAILNKDSSNIVPDDWELMINTIVDNYDAYDVFLITHGTNTLGYTCAALSFALGKLGKKVILTGSQVPFGYAGSDALMNLENAIRVAAYREHELAGVMAVFGSHIITGVRVKKTTEFEYDAFQTFSVKASMGRVGRVLRINNGAVEDHMKWLEPRARNRKELDIKKEFNMKIASLTEFPGMSPKIFEYLVNNGVQGIIMRASGAGDPNVSRLEDRDKYMNLRSGFEFLRDKEIPILVTTQASEGVASMDVNEPGMMAYDLGAIPAWDMSLEAMTVKLAWLLGRKFPYSEIRTLMTQSFRGEIAEIRR